MNHRRCSPALALLLVSFAACSGGRDVVEAANDERAAERARVAQQLAVVADLTEQALRSGEVDAVLVTDLFTLALELLQDEEARYDGDTVTLPLAGLDAYTQAALYVTRGDQVVKYEVVLEKPACDELRAIDPRGTTLLHVGIGLAGERTAFCSAIADGRIRLNQQNLDFDGGPGITTGGYLRLGEGELVWRPLVSSGGYQDEVPTITRQLGSGRQEPSAFLEGGGALHVETFLRSLPI